ncbi:hypothetical protein A3D36_01275 [Candidatus Nomurabacteria bacterium RIFCSPHIGHO2_02_FULL_36_29]|uniref:Uncharacterized protein n=1 Tax=Candidatus Nomurabacteria bacterium RIFCSPLOWO2_01_FULL_36_16 TaxID=1801767 RepID=A0A1F6WXL2_9BACT|nr:MAG: hypothetical protein A3D36_01275 [Candidatus Nomurabacteria bacterium RIFCSPHIGHO2_02_FULL_36_29]OGI86626.1 MAG: hypothetical protein A3A91_02840 [Candidatus Nomurabacteria bacterium RIFCSPLOWO2_01_FULL_36_16]
MKATAKIQKIIKLTVVLAFSAVLLFGFSGFGMMGMDMNSPMVNCPFGGHSMSICKMNPMEHIQEWQSMFTTLPAKDALSSLLSILLALLALFGLRFFKKFSLHDQPWPEVYISPFYLRKRQIFDPLKEAFSSGILNPKIF